MHLSSMFMTMPILSNSIYGNAGLGINFGSGPTANHPWPPGVTAGSGPNNYQNYPVLTRQFPPVIKTNEIQGRSMPRRVHGFLIQFFANPMPTTPAMARARRTSAQTTVTTDSTSNVLISALARHHPRRIRSIAATATDPDGNTSEFAKDLIPWRPRIISPSVSPLPPSRAPAPQPTPAAPSSIRSR